MSAAGTVTAALEKTAGEEASVANGNGNGNGTAYASKVREDTRRLALVIALVGVGAMGIGSIFSYPKWEAGATQAFMILAGVVSAIITGEYTLARPKTPPPAEPPSGAAG